MKLPRLYGLDGLRLWHPYTSVARPGRVWAVRRARGSTLELRDGRKLVDGMASWWCAVHGYHVPRLNAALAAQAEDMAHVMFGGLTHEPAVRLAELLVDKVVRNTVRQERQNLSKVFLCDSGSVAVEVALKMCQQYFFQKGRPEKNRFVALRGGYHGDTMGAMAVCDPEKGMHKMFRGCLPTHLFAPRPGGCAPGTCASAEGRCEGPCALDDGFAAMEALLREHHGSVAGVIVEPIVQGAGGMRFYGASYLDKLRRLCDELDVLLVFDEIATGFGRTGRMLATDYLQDGHAPDILCLGKALTGGYCTMGAVVASERVGTGVSGADGAMPFMHGPTFMGNPMAASIALASTELLLESPWEANVARIGAGLRRGLAGCAGKGVVRDVRVLGAIGVVELAEAPDWELAQGLQALLVSKGVWIRPFGELLYVMPPFIIKDDELATLCGAIADVVDELESGNIRATVARALEEEERIRGASADDA